MLNKWVLLKIILKIIIIFIKLVCVLNAIASVDFPSLGWEVKEAEKCILLLFWKEEMC